MQQGRTLVMKARRPTCVFFDGGPDAGGWWVGLWAPGLWGRAAVAVVPFCNQEIVECCVLQFAVTFIQAVG